MRVSLFITCLADTMFPQTGRAVVAVLERLGVGVDFPLEQTCCGQMHFNTGYADEAIPLVRRFTRTLPRASWWSHRRPHALRWCATTTGAWPRSPGMPRWRPRSPRSRHVCSNSASCSCGFGGTFAIKNADTSVAMLTDKVRAILDTGAEVCSPAITQLRHNLGHVTRSIRAKRAQAVA